MLKHYDFWIYIQDHMIFWWLANCVKETIYIYMKMEDGRLKISEPDPHSSPRGRTNGKIEVNSKMDLSSIMK